MFNMSDNLKAIKEGNLTDEEMDAILEEAMQDFPQHRGRCMALRHHINKVKKEREDS